jgi:hypothetical protein
MKYVLIVAFASLLAIGWGTSAKLSAYPQSAKERTAQPRTPREKKHVKKSRGSVHEAAKGGEDIAQGVGRGTESMAKGTVGSAGNLATGHPVMAGASLGKGAAGLGKNTGKGAVKGAGKIGKGAGGGLKKLGRKIF